MSFREVNQINITIIVLKSSNRNHSGVFRSKSKITTLIYNILKSITSQIRILYLLGNPSPDDETSSCGSSWSLIKRLSNHIQTRMIEVLFLLFKYGLVRFYKGSEDGSTVHCRSLNWALTCVTSGAIATRDPLRKGRHSDKEFAKLCETSPHILCRVVDTAAWAAVISGAHCLQNVLRGSLNWKLPKIRGSSDAWLAQPVRG